MYRIGAIGFLAHFTFQFSCSCISLVRKFEYFLVHAQNKMVTQECKNCRAKNRERIDPLRHFHADY